MKIINKRKRILRKGVLYFLPLFLRCTPINRSSNAEKDKSENTCTRCQNPSNNPAGIIPNNNKKHALTSAPLTDTHSQGQTCTRITDMHSGFVINPLFYSTPYQHRSHVILEPSSSCDSSFGPLCLCCL